MTKGDSCPKRRTSAQAAPLVKRRKRVPQVTERAQDSRLEQRATELLAAWDKEVAVVDCGYYPDEDMIDGEHYDLLLRWMKLIEREPKFEPLFLVFMSYFVITASAAGPERIFRISGLICSALRSNLSTEMIRILVFLRKNKDFVPSVEELVAEYWRRRKERAEHRRTAPRNAGDGGSGTEVDERAEVDDENPFEWDFSKEHVLDDLDSAMLVREIEENLSTLHADDVDEFEKYIIELMEEN